MGAISDRVADIRAGDEVGENPHDAWLVSTSPKISRRPAVSSLGASNATWV
jgi:hypothetical protein